MRRTLCAATLVAMVLGCRGKAGGASVTVMELEAGDVSCYVSVQEGNKSANYPSSFYLCEGGMADSVALIGTAAVLTLEKDHSTCVSCAHGLRWVGN
ncbi:MAG: hypothetical protein GWP91_21915 [Rhodobacterales bacterium]|nr:hypothetical protein [Rhodobacterales bacterium]